LTLATQFVELPKEVQQEALEAIAQAITQDYSPAKEVMREAIHNHRALAT
jgi:hypothetical protein